MKCICDQYNYGDENNIYQDYWAFQKNIYMGKLYKCIYCNTLWVEYTSGHGWLTYNKVKSDVCLLPPEKSIKYSSKKSVLTKSMLNKWDRVMENIIHVNAMKIGDVIVPDDIMSLLKHLFEDDKSIRKWFYTYREASTHFDTPIKIIKEENGIEKIKYLLLKYCSENKIKI